MRISVNDIICVINFGWKNFSLNKMVNGRDRVINVNIVSQNLELMTKIKAFLCRHHQKLYALLQSLPFYNVYSKDDNISDWEVQRLICFYSDFYKYLLQYSKPRSKQIISKYQ